MHVRPTSTRQKVEPCAQHCRVVDRPWRRATLARATATSSCGWRKTTVAANSRLEPCLATIVDARAIRPLRTVGKRGEEIGKLCVAAFGDQPRHGVASTPAGRLADQVEEQRLEVGQDDGAVAGHGRHARSELRERLASALAPKQVSGRNDAPRDRSALSSSRNLGTLPALVSVDIRGSG